jgi:hypothetical protein
MNWYKIDDATLTAVQTAIGEYREHLARSVEAAKAVGATNQHDMQRMRLDDVATLLLRLKHVHQIETT